MGVGTGFLQKKKQQAEADAAAARRAAAAPTGLWIDPVTAPDDPSQVQAGLIDAQRADFIQRYLPLEQGLMQQVTTPMENAANSPRRPVTAAVWHMGMQQGEFNRRPEEIAASSPWKTAGDQANRQMDITRGEFNRSLTSTGTFLTKEQQLAVDRKFGLDRARSIANAENTTRATVKDQNTTTQADLIGIGREIQGGVRTSLSDASSMQASREAASAAAKQAEQAQTQNMEMSAASLAIMAAYLI